MIPLISAVFVASLLGSVHCAGMCGGIVALCVGLEGPLDRRTRALSIAIYNGGRLITYTLLGAVSGALGAAADVGGQQFGAGRVAPIIAGAGLIVVGIVALGRSLGWRMGAGALPPGVQKFVQRGYRFAFDRPPLQRAALVGLFTGLLPCGWLYAFVVTAAGTGTAWGGALTMATFWLGTLPMMAALGAGLQTLAGPLRRHVPTFGAAALIVLGVVTVLFRVTLPAAANDAPVAENASLTQLAGHVHELDHTEMPCCRDEP